MSSSVGVSLYFFGTLQLFQLLGLNDSQLFRDFHSLFRNTFLVTFGYKTVKEYQISPTMTELELKEYIESVEKLLTRLKTHDAFSEIWSMREIIILQRLQPKMNTKAEGIQKPTRDKSPVRIKSRKKISERSDAFNAVLSLCND